MLTDPLENISYREENASIELHGELTNTQIRTSKAWSVWRRNLAAKTPWRTNNTKIRTSKAWSTWRRNLATKMLKSWR